MFIKKYNIYVLKYFIPLSVEELCMPNRKIHLV